MSRVLQDQRIHERIGRNLLVFQQIEAMLKKVLPFIVKAGRSNDAARVRVLRNRIKKAPFGSILDLLAESIDVLSPQFRNEIRTIAKGRNDLVHRLILLPEAGLIAGDRGAAVSFLDGQYAAALRFREIVFPMYESVEDALATGQSMRVVHDFFDEA